MGFIDSSPEAETLFFYSVAYAVGKKGKSDIDIIPFMVITAENSLYFAADYADKRRFF